jgi:hypothetical protein
MMVKTAQTIIDVTVPSNSTINDVHYTFIALFQLLANIYTF